MTSPSERLAALGGTLPPVAAPVAAYVPATRAGNLVFTSGQLPFVDGVLSLTGKVGQEVTLEQAQDLARIAGLNALAAAAAEVGGVDKLARIVKVTVFVASAADFTAQPAVANGASELFGAVFAVPHARAAVGVAALPMDAPVEVEVIAELLP